MQGANDLLRPPGTPAHGKIPPGCELRFFREGDERALLDLLVAAYPRWRDIDTSIAPIDYLHWKLRSHPDAARYHVVAALGARIIGCRLFLLQRINAGKLVLRARQGVDTTVHPDYQGSGLMTAMTYPVPDRLWDDFDMDFSVRSGREELRRIGRYDTRQNRYARVDVLEVDAATLAARPDTGVLEAASITTATRFDDRMRSFFKEAASPFWLIVERTPEYLNWRFGDARAGHYTIRQAEEDGRLLGCSVLASSRGRGYVADLLTLPERPDVVELLAGDALRLLVADGAGSAEWWSTPAHPYRDVFERLGFRTKKRQMEMYCQPFHVEDEALLPFEDPATPMHIVAGDTDLV